MKDLLASFIVVGLTFSVLTVPLAAAQAQGGGSVLGPVDALGQQVRRPPPPTTREQVTLDDPGAFSRSVRVCERRQVSGPRSGFDVGRSG
jgi:hypothetical protein